MLTTKTRKKINSHIKNYGDAVDRIFYNKITLPNGVRIISEEIPTVESFSLGIFTDVGSRNDPQGKEGLAHFLEHSLFRRTKTRSSRAIASEFESVGAYTNAYTTKEHLSFYVRALKPHFRKTFSLLSDLVLNPMFIRKEIEKERQIILEEIKSYEDDPEEMIFDEADKMLFTGHPLGVPIAGYSDTVKDISCSDLESFHSHHFMPDNILIACSGNILFEQIVNYSTNYFSKLNNNSSLSKTAPLERTNYKKKELDKPFSQTHLLLARRLPLISSEEKYPLGLLNIILGDGMSSRLNHQVRERHGLAYNVESSFQLLTDCGGFYIYAAMERKFCQKTEKLIHNQMLKLIESDITATELNRSKEQLKSSTVMAMESMSNRMQSLAKSELMLHRYEDISSTIDMIDSISLDEIKSTAEKYLNPSDWVTVVFFPEE